MKGKPGAKNVSVLARLPEAVYSMHTIYVLQCAPCGARGPGEVTPLVFVQERPEPEGLQLQKISPPAKNAKNIAQQCVDRKVAMSNKKGRSKCRGKECNSG